MEREQSCFLRALFTELSLVPIPPPRIFYYISGKRFETARTERNGTECQANPLLLCFPRVRRGILHS